MGIIHSEVEAIHLFDHEYERPLLAPFLLNFDVTHARHVKGSGSSISAYLLSPDSVMRRGFGFNSEIMLLISRYEKMQPRTMQLADQAYNLKPFSGRADPLTYFLVSTDQDVDEWVSNYLSRHPQTRTPICMSANEIGKSALDSWFIRNKLSRKLYSRDLFDYQLPLDSDLFFFGRSLDVDEFADAVRKCQNRGVFGLRKTGKTSLLFKLMRTLNESKISYSLYIDCKRPDIRECSWKGLLFYIVKEISKARFGKREASSDDRCNDSPVEALAAFLAGLKSTERLCLIFDEIEYVSPIASIDTHWKNDFVPFWQTLWSLQSRYRCLSFIIAGVNPFVCEIDLIDNVQNPMFGIVKPTHLTGLNKQDVKQMTAVIGSRMGMIFEQGAVDHLFERYGGHPLLTRMACSYLNQSLQQDGTKRPIHIDARYMKVNESNTEEELYYYCRHVVSELEKFYGDEYVLLEMLAAGSIVDFIEMAAEPGWVRHLKSYGIVRIEAGKRPYILIPVIQRYVAGESARKNRERSLRKIVSSQERSKWLAVRKTNISMDMKLLLRLLHQKCMWLPYGSQFLPEGDVFAESVLAVDWNSFVSSINSLNRCFVETIDIANGGSSSAFFTKLKSCYPELFEALHRIRAYRNNADHLRLNQATELSFNKFIEADFLGASLSSSAEPWFIMQQTCLDELFAAIQFELSKIN